MRAKKNRSIIVRLCMHQKKQSAFDNEKRVASPMFREPHVCEPSYVMQIYSPCSTVTVYAMILKLSMYLYRQEHKTSAYFTLRSNPRDPGG